MEETSELSERTLFHKGETADWRQIDKKELLYLHAVLEEEL